MSDFVPSLMFLLPWTIFVSLFGFAAARGLDRRTTLISVAAFTCFGVFTAFVSNAANVYVVEREEQRAAEEQQARERGRASAAEAVRRWDAAIESLGAPITRYPEDTSVPGPWKIDGQFYTCYAEGLPDPQATEAERDADPLLMCAVTGESFVPYDELGNGSDYAEASRQ